jgi:hypothetical protein
VPLAKDEIIQSVRAFKLRRDALLHEDVATFDHNFQRFLDFCQTDSLTQSVLAPIEANSGADVAAWWSAATRHEPTLNFPSDPDEEFSLRYRLIKSVCETPNYIPSLGIAHRQCKSDEWIELFRTLLLRPFLEELSHRLGSAADLATPEARDVQAVPLSRIPSPREAKIFLSHKTVDKPLVYRYHHCLKALGYDPWLDEFMMPAGANLEREILKGFEESCAAVFFITESFTDERYLATEVDYAIMQKRKKGPKFSIVTLRYSNAAPVPGLLTPYIYKDIANDLDGFHALITALPVELGPIRWKTAVA